MIEPENRPKFMGYKRLNGKVGTRNYIGILTSVNCSATAAKNIAQVFTDEKLSKYPNVDGVVSFNMVLAVGWQILVMVLTHFKEF